MNLRFPIGILAILAAASLAQTNDTTTVPAASAPSPSLAVPATVDSGKSAPTPVYVPKIRFAIEGQGVDVIPFYSAPGAANPKSQSGFGFRLVPSVRIETGSSEAVYLFAGYERSDFEISTSTDVMGYKSSSKTELSNQFLSFGLGFENALFSSTRIFYDMGVSYDLVLASEAETEITTSTPPSPYGSTGAPTTTKSSGDFDDAQSSMYTDLGIGIRLATNLAATSQLRMAIYPHFYDEGSGESNTTIRLWKLGLGLRYTL